MKAAIEEELVGFNAQVALLEVRGLQFYQWHVTLRNHTFSCLFLCVCVCVCVCVKQSLLKSLISKDTADENDAILEVRAGQ